MTIERNEFRKASTCDAASAGRLDTKQQRYDHLVTCLRQLFIRARSKPFWRPGHQIYSRWNRGPTSGCRRASESPSPAGISSTR
jgi:hypothetical protein